MAVGRASSQADSPLAIELLSSLLDRLGPLGLAVEPASGRMRVVVDALGGAQTLGTVTTVTTLGTVNTVTNLAQIGSMSANFDQVAQMQSVVSPLRSRITVS